LIDKDEKKIKDLLKNGKDDDISELERDIKEENNEKLREENLKIIEDLKLLAEKLNIDGRNMTKMYN